MRRHQFAGNGQGLSGLVRVRQDALDKRRLLRRRMRRSPVQQTYDRVRPGKRRGTLNANAAAVAGCVETLRDRRGDIPLKA
ncbi:hypothetical protein BURPS406E_P0340 [Burkholderia pseudomallei 406e]|nr:hypothetical protein BURPS406E_P0340 [Burkholderia pseudomallei 406e]